MNQSPNPQSSPHPIQRNPLWLDCDTGHDDAFALILSIYHPHLHLIGCSTVHGNAPLTHTTWNTLSILTAVGSPDIPVYPGAEKPLKRSAVHAPNYHGETGLDGTQLLPEPVGKAMEGHTAVEGMRDAIMGDSGVWLIATGALTNIAELVLNYPEVVGKIDGLSIMGGCVGDGFTEANLGGKEKRGNWTDWAEFNIYCDPEAAAIVFGNEELASKTTIVTLDLSHQVIATEQVRAKLLKSDIDKGIDGPQTQLARQLRPLFNDLLCFFAATYRKYSGLVEGPPLHDPIAVAAVLSQAELTIDDRGGERWDVQIVTEGEHSDDPEKRGQVGRTVVTRKQEGEAGVRIPRGMDVQHFWQLIHDALTSAESELLAQQQAA